MVLFYFLFYFNINILKKINKTTIQLQSVCNLFRSRDRAASPKGCMLIAGCCRGEEVKPSFGSPV